MLLLAMIIYVFGILFVQATTDYLVIRDMEDDSPFTSWELSLMQYYKSLPLAMFTLFKAVAGGVSWEIVVDPLGRMNGVWIAFFTAYISFVYFAVLNVVTGVFCNSAIENAQHDQELLVHTQMKQKNMYIQKLKALFIKIDNDDFGSITIGDFEMYLQEPSVQAYFAS